MDGLFGELHNRTGFDVAPGIDMVADPGRRGAQRSPFAIMVGVDDHNRFLGAHLDDKLPRADSLFGCQAQVRIGVGSHRPVDVKPGIEHSHLDESIDPFLPQEVVDVGASQAGADTREDSRIQGILKTLQRLAQHPGPTAPLIADDLGPLHGNQRGDVPELPHSFRPFGGNEVAVGEDLEIAIRVLGEHVEQLRVQERLAPDNAEEHISHLPGLAHQFVERLRADGLLLQADIDPTPLAAEVTGINDRHIQERREELPALEPPLVLVNR